MNFVTLIGHLILFFIRSNGIVCMCLLAFISDQSLDDFLPRACISLHCYRYHKIIMLLKKTKCKIMINEMQKLRPDVILISIKLLSVIWKMAVNSTVYPRG